MRLKQLRQFVAVAEAGSLRGAARLLGISQPTLTKSLRHLEEQLDVSLFLRSIRGITLTRSGEALLPHARAVQAESDKALEALDALRGNKSGAIAVSIAPAVIPMLPETLRIFRARHPEAMVTVIDGLFPTGVSLVRAGRADLYIGPLPLGPGDSDLRFQTLFVNEMAITCRFGHPKEKSVELADLREARWVFGGPLGLQGKALHDAFAKRGLAPPASVTQCESFMALLALVSVSDFLTVMPRRLLESGPFTRILKEVPLRERFALPPVQIVSKVTVRPSTIVRSFIAALRSARNSHQSSGGSSGS
jgi:DNA-binding transcriptional LysR family regulator